jgi:hypothetical protein
MVPVCKPGTKKKKSVLNSVFSLKFCVLGTVSILEETMLCEEVGFW